MSDPASEGQSPGSRRWPTSKLIASIASIATVVAVVVVVVVVVLSRGSGSGDSKDRAVAAGWLSTTAPGQPNNATAARAAFVQIVDAARGNSAPTAWRDPAGELMARYLTSTQFTDSGGSCGIIVCTCTSALTTTDDVSGLVEDGRVPTIALSAADASVTARLAASGDRSHAAATLAVAWGRIASDRLSAAVAAAHLAAGQSGTSATAWTIVLRESLHLQALSSLIEATTGAGAPALAAAVSRSSAAAPVAGLADSLAGTDNLFVSALVATLSAAGIPVIYDAKASDHLTAAVGSAVDPNHAFTDASSGRIRAYSSLDDNARRALSAFVGQVGFGSNDLSAAALGTARAACAHTGQQAG